jgi:hypothetical protein
MKKIVWTLCLLCGLLKAAQAQTEAVGINTENPKGVLHIDGASTPATVNPPAGDVSAFQASDDVVVDTAGRIGAGVIAPAAKVDMYATAPGEALRIKDGTQGDGKVLVSDADGTATWTLMPNGGIWWYAALYMEGAFVHNTAYAVRPVTGYTAAFVSSASEGSVSATAGTITVPFQGIYRITLNLGYNSNRASDYKATAVLRVNNASRWTPTVWGVGYHYGTGQFFVGLLNLNGNDVISLALDQTLNYSATAILPQTFMVELMQLTE